MPKKKEVPKQVTFEYKISPMFTVHAVSGVFGGLNSHGQIIMNFFHERHAIPRTQTYDVMEDGNIGKEPVAEERKQNVIRDVMLGISIDAHTARSFARWLQVHAEQLERIVKQMGNDADVQEEQGVH